jgi:SAM-dependent methyltransferase
MDTNLAGTEPQKTWEDAVRWLREQPDRQELVRDSYYDDPLAAAAERYRRSGEWQAISVLLGPGRQRKALELGAGRGIASYALAADGFAVTALEPDPSLIVGAGAIRALAAECALPIEVVEQYSETLPFEDASFDLVFARAVLHHTRDLDAALREAARVLKPGGRLVAVREHVISRDEDLDAFFAVHPLHSLYGGENAYRLDRYRGAIRSSGLRLERVLAPLTSPINHAPHDRAALGREIGARLGRVPGLPFLVELLVRTPLLGRGLLGLAGLIDHRPGRLYSFVARRD